MIRTMSGTVIAETSTSLPRGKASAEHEIEAAPHRQAGERLFSGRPKPFYAPGNRSAVWRETDAEDAEQQVGPADVEPLSRPHGAALGCYHIQGVGWPVL